MSDTQDPSNPIGAAAPFDSAQPPVLHGLEEGYDQIKLMAIGGMAEVYRGRQKSLDRPVAIKRMRPELKQNRDLQERFRREAKSSANFLHQNLAHVYDYRSSHNEAYIIMEWIDGFDLAEIIERLGAIPVDVSCIIALKILNGLGYIHSHGMIHRDIKPDNVRVSARGDVKIMDFGIAFDPTESNLTMPGTLIGSPHYLSPEQIVGSKIDSRVDVFSFGISFYEMLTGKKPFFETQTESVYERIKKGAYIIPQNIVPGIPAFLIKIVESCLQTKPARRPASCEQLIVALQQFIATNFTNDHESRLRQFLIQSKLLHGNPRLIEVEEKTGPNLSQQISRSKKWNLIIAGVIGVALAFLFYGVLRWIKQKGGT